MTGLVTILRREFSAFFYAPIAYVVGVAFLALQGFSFWALMRSLSDPRAPAEVGAVLRSFFGGTLLHWFTVFALVALLSMRSVSEDRRTGAWEALLTTRVRASTVIVGKWLALVSFYCLLWLPSIFLVVIFTRYLPSGQALDLGPVVAAYLGTLWIGAALLAVGVAVSTATENQIIAAVLSFSLYLAWLMLGEYGGDTGTHHWLLLVDLRETLAEMARGAIATHFAVALASVIVVALTLATALSARDRGQRLRLLAATLCFVLAGGSLSHLAGRHGPRMDWSSARVNSLEPSTTAMLAQVSEPLEVIVVLPTEQVFDSVHAEVLRLLRRMQAAQKKLSIRLLDPLAEPSRVRDWAYELAIRPEDLSSGGAVIFEQGARRRAVDLLAMASFRSDDLGVGSLAEFRAESAFRAALAEVTRRESERLCVSTGHGEISIREGALHWNKVATRIESDGAVLRPLRVLSSEALAGCDAVIVMGPAQPFEASEALALGAYLSKGGHAMIALRSRPEAGDNALPQSGLALLLESRGIVLRRALVVDPASELELKPAWMTYGGYGDHPIVQDFQNRRATVWDAPVALSPTGDTVKILVRASEQAWAESNLAELYGSGRYEQGPDELVQPAVALAHQDASGSRLVVLGSAESMSSEWSDRGIGGNDRLFLSSALWVLGRDVQLQAEDKRPEYLRLLMSPDQLKSAFVWCVVVGPLFFALFGAGLWWWRRREQ